MPAAATSERADPMENWNVVYSHNIACTEKQGFANGGVDPEYVYAQKIAQWLGDDATAVSDLERSDREVLIGADIVIDSTSDGHLLRMLDVKKRYGRRRRQWTASTKIFRKRGSGSWTR